MALETEELKFTVESPAAWARRVRITVPAEQIAKERRQALARVARKVRLPGFRQGKVPAHVVEKRFGPAVEQETLERVMGEAYREMLRREGFRPITDGSIDNVVYEAGTDLTFDVGFEVRPEIALERIGGFIVKRPPADVDDAQVNRVLERLREEQASWRPLEGEPAVNGDMVAVEIVPLDDALEAAPSPRRYEVVLGEGQVVPAVEEVLRTLGPGEEGEFTVELPENTDDPASPVKAHRIHVRMLEAKRAEKPALDDAFAASLGEFADLAELRARIATDLGVEAEREAERAMRHQLIAHIIEANPFEVPASMTNEYLTRLLPAREGADPQRVAEARESVRGGAEFAIRRLLVIERIAEMESLAATESELDQRIADMAERMSRPVAEVKTTLRKNGRLAELAQELTEDKVFGYLTSLSTIE